MVYGTCDVSIGERTFTYICEHDELISSDEMESLCMNLALLDAVHEAECLEDALEFEVESKSEEMEEDEFAYRVLGRNCQLVDSIRSFGNRLEVYTNIYQIFSRDVSKEPVCYGFDADCGQEPEVDTIGVVDFEHPQEEVFEEAWRDLLYQLRRYFKVSGLALKSGVFHLSKMSAQEYEDTRKERELVLA